jgi:hypothetical protein
MFSMDAAIDYVKNVSELVMSVVIVAKVEEGRFSCVEEGAPSLSCSILIVN